MPCEVLARMLWNILKFKNVWFSLFSRFLVSILFYLFIYFIYLSVFETGCCFFFSSGWLEIHNNPPVSASQKLGLQVYATTPSSVTF